HKGAYGRATKLLEQNDHIRHKSPSSQASSQTGPATRHWRKVHILPLEKIWKVLPVLPWKPRRLADRARQTVWSPVPASPSPTKTPHAPLSRWRVRDSSFRAPGPLGREWNHTVPVDRFALPRQCRIVPAKP